MCVPRTVQLLMINITFWFLISKWRNFLIILFWVSFKLIEWGFATSFTFRRHATATTNPWVDQCTVCSVLKLDTFTLVTVTFEWLGRFWKTKFSWKLITLQKFPITYFFKIQNQFFIKKYSKCYTFFRLTLYTNSFKTIQARTFS